MIDKEFIDCFKSYKGNFDNAATKEELDEFMSNNYMPATIANVSVGTDAVKYDLNVKPKKIMYFLTQTEKIFNYYFDVNNCRVFQNGKYISVEVPNKETGLYGFKDCLLSLQKITDHDGKMYISIGEKSGQENINYDLASMPHFLVAGQTGSGKSVFLHNVILSLLGQYGTDDLQMVLIDPKQVEFGFYDGVPQVESVISDSSIATRKIRSLCDEMDERYNVLKNNVVRDIASYNRLGKSKMPRIIVIVEELADLVLSQGDEVIKDITRLVVKARACGIHVILATQRPEARFFTGKLTSNFQCRVAFSVASVDDSRIILGCKGAETLLGNGDGIFRSNNGQSNTRFKSALVTESDIKKAVSLLQQV